MSATSNRARAVDLLRQMTRGEKVAQLTGVMHLSLIGTGGLDGARMKSLVGEGIGHISAPGMFGAKAPPQLAAMTNSIQRFLVEETRLGIPAICHNEATNGVVAPGFTNFPTPIGLAATWNPGLVEELSALTARQMRSVGLHQALSPVLDIARDARWGRVHETFGEDPYLITALGLAFTRGLQGADLATGVVATAKHFLGYGLSEAGQNMAAVRIGPRELHDVFARPFAAAIRDAGLRSVMNSYSEIDGVPSGIDRALLTDLLRGLLGFDGVVVSDYATIATLVDRLLVATSREEAGALALDAGIDVELPTAFGFGPHLERAVDEGLVTQDAVDAAVLRVLTMKYELGLFDDPYVREDADALLRLAGIGGDLSLELARQSVTLLKNDDGTLPLSPQIARIAVIGPHADSAMAGFPAYTHPAALAMLGAMAGGGGAMAGLDDAGDVFTPEGMQEMFAELGPAIGMGSEPYVRANYAVTTLLDEIRRVAPEAEIGHEPGTGLLVPIPGGIEAAVACARDADAVVLAIGGASGWFAEGFTEGEGSDTADIALPAAQAELVRQVAGAGAPVVAVLFQGRPLALGNVAGDLAAIVTGYFGGQAGARALAEALFGAVNPGGKLPVTVPRHSGQVPIYHYQSTGSGYRRTHADVHRGYTDMPATPLFAFGHGLSYTTFAYDGLELGAAEVDTAGTIEVAFTVANTGAVAGSEVAQVYAHQPVRGITRPAQELVGFVRVDLDPGALAHVRFAVPVALLAHTGADHRFAVAPGPVTLSVGGSSADTPLTASVDVTGPRRPVSAAERVFLSMASVSPA